MVLEIGTIVKSAPFIVADLTELLIFFSYENKDRFTQSDIENLLSEIPLQDSTEEAFVDDESDSVISLKMQTLAEDVFRHIVTRQQRFKEWYPFNTSEAHIELQDRESLTDKNYTYLFLVLCSRLRTLKNQSDRGRLASYFTELSKYAMQALLPAHGDVKIFDANSQDRKEYFGTDLREAMLVLAGYTSAYANEENCRKLSSSGDGGLDLVGKVCINDGAPGALILFGQCASREKSWPGKTLEASPQRFRTELQFTTDPYNCVFIPVDYRDSNLDWQNLHNTNGCFLIDRQRLLYLLDNNESYVATMSAESWFKDVKESLGSLVGAEFL